MRPSAGGYLAAAGWRLAHSQPVSLAPRMTGKMLVNQFLGPPTARVGSGVDLILWLSSWRRATWTGSTTRPKGWPGATRAASSHIKPHERNFALFRLLKELPKETLKGNAAPLLWTTCAINFPVKNKCCRSLVLAVEAKGKTGAKTGAALQRHKYSTRGMERTAAKTKKDVWQANWASRDPVVF
jgi:hypothetical protein